MFLIAISSITIASEIKNITIVHTNDMHSHLLGFSPNIDYTPYVLGDDKTRGGWARIATVISDIKKSRGKDKVVVADGGDFMMGSLFHIVSREYALEFRLLKMMGYDVAGLGNHEFDFFPDGLAKTINSGKRLGGIPQLVLSNIIFDKKSDKDNTLEEVYNNGDIKPYHVIVKDGVKIGFFAVLGENGVKTAPFAKPLKFSVPIDVAKKIVKTLRKKEKVDIVVCLSHSGFREGVKGSEDWKLSKAVPGIDVIVAGHSHKAFEKPFRVDDTLIIHTGKYGKNVGVLDLTIVDGKVNVKNYELIKIDDTIKSDPKIISQINTYKSAINMRFLKFHGFGFDSIIANTKFDLLKKNEESNIGNLIADSMLWYSNKFISDGSSPSEKIEIAIESNGVIRDDLLKGKTGNLAMCDIFRSFSLGIGLDGKTLTYPLISFYLTAADIKSGLEILTTVYPAKGDIFYLQYSGVRMQYNPNRVMFDRVTDIWIGSEKDGYKELDYSSSNKKLYRVVANIYNATFFKLLGGFTYNILEIIPKDKDGNPIKNLKDARIDADISKEGIQEVKEWIGITKYFQSFEDIDGDGIPDVPEKYRGKLGRAIVNDSMNPVDLLRGGNYVTWIAFSVIVLLFSMSVFLVRFVYKKIVLRQAQ